MTTSGAIVRSPLSMAVIHRAHSHGSSRPPGRLLKYSQPMTPPKRACWPTMSGITVANTSKGMKPEPLCGFVTRPTTTFSGGQPFMRSISYMMGLLQSPHPQFLLKSNSAAATGAKVIKNALPKSALSRSTSRTAPPRLISSSTSRSSPSRPLSRTTSLSGR
ncbi:hypothetical protein VM1G_11780 [Cytospora mali]|uniref:Uncharacterized protein n=1 Tax=Cytospora mali TaxID=578113 RepID=A0A194W4G9_CYTMA|nr:hypothetical protein VM1G_11780 [Valsa mali]